MARLDLGPLGVAVNVSDTYLDEVRELEDLGYSALWLPGGQLDRLDRLADVVHATRAVPVAPAVIPLDVYGPDAIAGLHAAVEADAPGRLLIGLGGPQRARPLAAVNDALDRLDRAEPPVPVSRRVLAALGPRKLALARDRTAGAVTLLVTPRWTRTARDLLGPASVLVVDQLAVLGTDADAAREAARGPVQFLSGVPGYRSNVVRMGFPEAEIIGLGDRLVDELVAWGDADAVAARIAEHHRAGADHVVLTVLDGDGVIPPMEGARQVARVLLR